MCVCVCVYACVCMYVSIYVLDMYMCVCIYACMGAYVPGCLPACTYIYICMRVRMLAFACIYVTVNLYNQQVLSFRESV